MKKIVSTVLACALLLTTAGCTPSEDVSSVSTSNVSTLTTTTVSNDTTKESLPVSTENLVSSDSTTMTLPTENMSDNSTSSTVSDLTSSSTTDHTDNQITSTQHSTTTTAPTSETEKVTSTSKTTTEKSTSVLLDNKTTSKKTTTTKKTIITQQTTTTGKSSTTTKTTTKKSTSTTIKPTTATQSSKPATIRNQVLEGVNYGTGQGAVVGNTVYYTYHGISTLFAYDGNIVKEIPVVGNVTQMICDGEYIYYVDKSKGDVCRVDLQTYACEVIFEKTTEICHLLKYNDNLFVIGVGEDDVRCVYMIHAQTQNSQLIREEDIDSINAKFELTIINTDCYVAFLGLSANWARYCVVDLKTGKTADCDKATYNRNSMSYRFNDTKNFQNSNHYRCRRLQVGDWYYVIGSWHSSAYTGDRSYWTVNTSSGQLLRVNEKTDKHEQLTNVKAPYWVSMVAVGEQRIVFMVWDRKLQRVFVYTMTPDAKGLECIGAEVNGVAKLGADAQSVAQSVTAQLSALAGDFSNDNLDPQACDICGGDGRQTCNYCGGSGRGTPIYVLGEKVEQGCSYCGSAGWRVCSGCHGYGEK